MWCEKRPNGKVRFGERYEHPLTGKTNRVLITMDKDTASTRKQGQGALNDKINDLLGNIIYPSQSRRKTCASQNS